MSAYGSLETTEKPKSYPLKMSAAARLEFKQGFLKVPSRAVRLQECPLRELQLYFKIDIAQPPLVTTFDVS